MSLSEAGTRSTCQDCDDCHVKALLFGERGGIKQSERATRITTNISTQGRALSAVADLGVEKTTKSSSSLLATDCRYICSSINNLREPDGRGKTLESRTQVVAKKRRPWRLRSSHFSVWLNKLLPVSRHECPNNGGRSESSSLKLEIMSVEDDETQQMFLRRILVGKFGFSFVPVHSGEEALRRLAKLYEEGGECNLPTAILMDIDLPGISGIETLGILREIYPNVPLPVIVVTSSEDDETMHRCFEAGAADVIRKPLSKSDIISRLGVQLRVLEFWNGQLEAQRHKLLLREMLPESIIDRLNSGQRLIYDELEEVTIVFTDIVGFTTMASSLPTERLIRMLDELFSEFDRLTDCHGVYKIETIGEMLCMA